jgi:SRSO17 transposase
LPNGAWREVAWREGAAEELSSRFATLRVRPAQGDLRGDHRSEPRPEQWLLIEWSEDECEGEGEGEGQSEGEEMKFWFSTLPADTPIERLVYLAKLRWLIERDYPDLKQEVGLGDYEGRGWRGFHHHAALSIAAYDFLIAEKAALPPSAPETVGLVKAPALPDGYRPRGGANQDRTPCTQLNRHDAEADRASPRGETTPMSMLHQDHRTSTQ